MSSNGTNKVKADKIPANSYRLFIKLYCERKGEKDKKTIQEAKKSWISLSLSKKKLFYKTSTEGNLLKYAHSLCNTETFLKEKNFTKPNNEFNEPNSIEDYDEKLEANTTLASNNNSDIKGNDFQPSVEKQIIYDDKNRNNTNSEVLNETRIVLSSNDTNQSDLESPLHEPAPSNNETRLEDSLEIPSNTDSNQVIATRLDEPAPPTVKIGKDLYEMIKGPGEKDWKDITKKEKNEYNCAVRALKREYIKNYTKYLESLSQQQLFDHYMKTLLH